jgi:hypothetical protein
MGVTTLCRAVVVLFFLCVGLGDLCRDSARVLTAYQQGNASLSSLYLAAVSSKSVNRHALLSKLISAAKQQPETFYWWQLAASLDYIPAIHLLAREDHNTQHYWQKAAELGDPLGQFMYAQSLQNERQKLLWLGRAAQQGLLAANISLYQWWLAKQDIPQAIPWLRAAAIEHAESAIILARHDWRHQQYASSLLQFKHARQLNHPQAEQQLQLASRLFNALKQEEESAVIGAALEREHCEIRLAMVVSSLDSAIQAQGFQQQFAQDRRLAELPICLEPILWVKDEYLTCHPNSHTINRISCQLDDLIPLFSNSSATHGALFTNKGKANVDKGLMYLDLEDTYDVFVHELAHFAGFVDEYPLSQTLADQFCNGTRQANLIFVDADKSLTEITSEYPEAKRLEKSRTCDNHPRQAYKLFYGLTFMEFYDQTNIPDDYLQLWKSQLEQRQVIPMYLNFAFYLEANEQREQATFWRNKYQAFVENR